MNASERPIVPFHIWKHEVTTEALRKAAGVDSRIITDVVNEFGSRWWAAHEPIWMAVDSVVFVARRRVLELRADREVAAMRRAQTLFTCSEHDAVGMGRCQLCAEKMS